MAVAWHRGRVDDEVPVYAVAEDPAPGEVVRIREVIDLFFEMLLLGAIFGFLLGASSNYVKLLFVPLGAFAVVLLRRLFVLLARIFTS